AVQAFSAQTLISSGTNIVNNLDNSQVYTQTNFPFYMYGIGSTRSELYSAGGKIVTGDLQSSSVTIPGSTGVVGLGEGTCSPSAANYDALCADATTHSMLLSDNTGALSPVCTFAN